MSKFRRYSEERSFNANRIIMMMIRLVGAGLPRTGTLSMKSALTILLKGKCYHMSEQMLGDQVIEITTTICP